jgi:hypothetical protein
MRQATINNQRNYSPQLRVIKETPGPNKKEDKLVDAAWNFVYTALWNAVQFSSKEAENAKQQIAVWLQSENKEKTFIAFCERVLLARNYVTKNPSRYIPLPSVWFDSNNKLGFAGTQRWHDDIKAIRESMPGYKTEIKALAEAILELSKDAPGLLNLFQTVAVQQLYN